MGLRELLTKWRKRLNCCGEDPEGQSKTLPGGLDTGRGTIKGEGSGPAQPNDPATPTIQESDKKRGALPASTTLPLRNIPGFAGQEHFTGLLNTSGERVPGEGATEKPATDPGLPTDVVANTTRAAPQENPESTFSSGARVALEIARESADTFAPLKSVLGGLCAFVKHFDQTKAVKEQTELLLARVKHLETLFHPSTDEEELKRRSDCRSTLNEIEQKLGSLQAKGKIARFAENVKDADTVKALLGELNDALGNYQLKQLQAVYDQGRRLIDDNDWRLPDRCMPVLAAEYGYEARRGCLLGTREAALDKVEVWVKGSVEGSEKSAIF